MPLCIKGLHKRGMYTNTTGMDICYFSIFLFSHFYVFFCKFSSPWPFFMAVLITTKKKLKTQDIFDCDVMCLNWHYTSQADQISCWGILLLIRGRQIIKINSKCHFCGKFLHKRGKFTYKKIAMDAWFFIFSYFHILFYMHLRYIF